jgi:hypothetical protein
MKLTRRKLAALAAAAVAAPSSVPAAPQQPSAGEDLLKAKRGQMQANAAALANVDVPMATEPAFQFKA